MLGWEGPLTHRQFIAWQEWRGMQWNIPDRHDYYLMQLNADVRRFTAKNPKQVTMDSVRLEFGRTEEKKKPKMSREQATQMAKFRWGLYLRAASGDKWKPPQE